MFNNVIIWIIIYVLSNIIFKRFADDTEFYEGVKSVLVDKNYKPNWKFKNFKSIDEEYIQKIF